MLSIREPLSRREWLRVGGTALGGLSLAGRLAARTDGPARACIVLFLAGGPPQHDTWDPKPDAPPEVRGELGSVASSVPGLRVGELMPKLARQAHRWAVLRAVATDDNAHSSSGYWMLTGTPHNPLNVENARPGFPNDWPSAAAVVRRLRPDAGRLPSAVTLPEPVVNNPNLTWPGQDGGFLGRSADPWLLTCDPSAAAFRVPELTLPPELPPLRLAERRSLLSQVGRHLDGVAGSPAAERLGGLQQRAFELLRSPEARRAFDLDAEPPAVRDRYGRHKFGQSVLLARRLVEAGVSFVQVNWPREPNDRTANSPLWDTHAGHAGRMRTALMPPMDAAAAALVDDLADRGLLDSTLVVWAGEFGRTPKINANGGRDHWGHVFSVALAGGGVRGGAAHGASDRTGARPKDGRVLPQDLLATVYHLLGHPPETEMRDAAGRPLPICRGEVVRPIL